MEVVNIIFVLCLYFCLGEAKKPRASYIKPCSKSAADFDQCCLEHGKEALLSMIHGDPEYKLPNLSPFEIPSITAESGGFKLALKNVLLYGLENNDLKLVKFDLNRRNVTVKIYFNTLSIIGDYEMDGRILSLKLEGNGKLNLTAVGADVTYSIIYKLQNIDGDDYFVVDSATSDFDFKRVYIDLDNLFNGDKLLGETTNRALNDNWREFIESVKPMIEDTIVAIGNSVIGGFGSTVPFEDIFLE